MQRMFSTIYCARWSSRRPLWRLCGTPLLGCSSPPPTSKRHTVDTPSPGYRGSRARIRRKEEAASDYAKPQPRLTRARRERESPWRPCRPHVRARAACGNAGARARCAVVKHTRARPPCVPSHDDEPNASALPCVSTYTALSRDGHVTRRSAVFASPAVQPPSSVKMHFFSVVVSLPPVYVEAAAGSAFFAAGAVVPARKPFLKRRGSVFL